MKRKIIKTGNLLLVAAAIFMLANSCKKEFKPDDPVTDIDGNVYKTIKIGKQIWMAENLKVTHYRNGDAIINITDNSLWDHDSLGAYCDYNNSPETGNIYGRLYNWNAVKDNRNIAPQGWHVATYDDWMTLVQKYGGEAYAGGRLKEKGTDHWMDPNTEATNETGFTAFPGGYRDSEFSSLNEAGFWWAATISAESSYLPYYFHIYYNDGAAWCSIDFLYQGKAGRSVRCVKD
jgi:uncharacterized protein (TIGR02145 family)